MRQKSLDMSYLVLCTILITLYLASFASSETTLSPSSATSSVVFELKGHLQLPCNMSDHKKGQEVIWTKDGKSLRDLNLGSRLKEDQTLLTIEKATLDEAGNYTCKVVLGDRTLKEAHFSAEMKPILRMQANINVVEGEKLYIHCNVIGRPMPEIAWEIGNKTYNTSEDRVRLMNDSENGVDNAILIIEDIQLSDRDEYVCMARAPSQDTYTAKVKTLVRVKDKLAALWPFLGICAEVVVLCAIILIYEKKRNKSELEESDTDQSPDQKNTPDHGKDSDVRQRK